MADKTLRSITFPGLGDRYMIPEQVSIDATLSQQGKAADAKAVGNAFKAQIAPAYSTAGTYAVGDLVLYNNALYRCKTAITTAEAWTPAHWEATTINDVAQKVTDLESASMALDASKAPVIVSEASGSIANFGDGADGLPMKSLVASIEPVQDLHGFDHPWPAGSGKNKLNNAISSSSGTFAGGIAWTLNSDGSVTVNGTATTTDNLHINADAESLPAGNYILNGCPDGGSSSTYRLVAAINSGASYAVDGGSGAALNLQEGDTFRCYIRVNSGTTINATYYPMIRLATEIDGTYEPYSNICPISGYTGLSGKRTGKNVLEIKRANATTNGVTFTKQFDADGNCIGVLANGTATAFTVYDFNVIGSTIQPTDLVDGQSYVFTGLPSSGSASTYGLRIANDQGQSIDGRITDVNGRTFTKSSDMVIFGFMMSTGCTVTDLLIQPMIRPASNTDSTFEPYTAKSISVNWQDQAGTVYGGTVDVISGKMVVNTRYGFFGPEGSGANFRCTSEPVAAYPNTYVYFNSSIGSAIVPNESVQKTQAICSHLPSISRGEAGAGYSKVGVFQYHSGDTNQFRLAFPKEDRFSTNEKFNAWLQTQIDAGTPLTVCFPLKETTTYQLTPQEVTTLLGNNVVYTDVGPVSVTAPRDTKMYVDNKIAEAVAAALNA